MSFLDEPIVIAVLVLLFYGGVLGRIVSPQNSRQYEQDFANAVFKLKHMKPAKLAEIDRAIDRNQKLQAIKVFREFTGVGLRASKDIIERRIAARRANPSLRVGTPEPTTSMELNWAPIDDLIHSKKFISAIKEYRAQTHSGLKEAKEAVESRRDRLSFH